MRFFINKSPNTNRLPRYHLSRLTRAIIEFDMITDGDRILIGLSGGKDSSFLAFALANLQAILPRKFELAAITMDPMFTDDFDPEPIADFCASLAIPWHFIKVNVAQTIEANKGKDPCFTCSLFRRGAINKFAAAHGFNKIAYAHHHDDAVETFLMSILCSGQLTTFLPVTYLDRTDLTVIRPLIYFRERELAATPRLHGFTPVASPCPLNGKTKRQEIKELIDRLAVVDPAVYTHLAAAMRQREKQSLWPPEPSRAEMKQKHLALWQKRDSLP